MISNFIHYRLYIVLLHIFSFMFCHLVDIISIIRIITRIMFNNVTQNSYSGALLKKKRECLLCLYNLQKLTNKVRMMQTTSIPIERYSGNVKMKMLEKKCESNSTQILHYSECLDKVHSSYIRKFEDKLNNRH